MFGDTLYEVKWHDGIDPDGVGHQVQLYISSVGDTIVNQYVYYNSEGIIDTLKSEFYSLEIFPTDTVNQYRGVLVLYTMFDKMPIDAQNRRRLQLLYDDIADSIRMRSAISERSTRLEFYYTNTIDHHLTGVLLQDVFRDTIIDKDSMVQYGKTRLLIDTRESTNNSFITSHRFLKLKRLGNIYGYFLE